MDVSIVTPTYNRAHLLPRVWNSVRNQKAELEWIVSDDGSTDGTEGVVRQFGDARIQYIRSAVNKGVNAARNAGVTKARGRYVIFLDSDDELYPGVLGTMIHVLDQSEQQIGVASFQCIQASDGRIRHHLAGGQVLDEYEIVVHRALEADTILVYRREVFDHFSLDGTIRGGECEFVYRVSQKYKFVTVAQPGSIVHTQEDNLSSSDSKIRRSSDIARAWERILHNHRKILFQYPGARRFYLKRALYRHVVGGDREGAWRVFGQAFKSGDMSLRIQALLMMVLAITRTGGVIEGFRGWMEIGKPRA